MRDTADFDVNDFEDVESTKGVYAKFYNVPKRMPDVDGKPVYENRAYIEIIAAGNQNNIVRRPASDIDKRRFRQMYEKFMAGDTEQVTGTPLTEVTWISKGQVEELMYMKVRSLEQLADLSDQVCTGHVGWFDLKSKAKRWLDKIEKDAPMVAMNDELEKVRKEMAAMKKQIEDSKKAEKKAG